MLHKQLWMNFSGSSRNLVFESTVLKTVMKHLSTEGLYKFADAIKPQANETGDWIEDGDIMRTFVKMACMCGYRASTLQD